MKLWKKLLVSSVAASLIAGGATSALAAKPDWAGKPASAKSSKNDDKRGKNDDVRGIHIEVNGKKIVLTFEDVERESAWALQYIAELVKRGVFTGYEDGTFRPNQKVTRIEAITAAVRQMGLRAQAESAEEMSTELNFKDADKIEKKYPWAVGYVAVALENDLFLETEKEVQPEKPADRLWATILLVKALGLEDQAKAKMNTELAFKDRKEIPAGAVGYVAVAVEKGLVTGYENNTFRPNQPVTRAELAAILDRTGDQIPDNESGFGQFSGTLAGVTSDGKASIVVNGQTKTYAVSSDVTVLRGNTWAKLSDLRAGDKVTAVLSNGVIVYVNVTESATTVDGQKSGTVMAIGSGKLTIAKDGKTAEYSVKSDATVLRGNAEAKLSDIRVGDIVTVIVSNGSIVHIHVTTAVSQNGQTDGVVSAVYDGKIEVFVNGVKTEYGFESNATIVRHNEVVELKVVQPGDEVRLTLLNGKVLLLTVTKPISDNNVAVYTVKGKYEGHRTESGKVTQISISASHDGKVVTRVYNVAADAVVSGNALSLEKGKTDIELLVANQVVTAVAIQ